MTNTNTICHYCENPVGSLELSLKTPCKCANIMHRRCYEEKRRITFKGKNFFECDKCNTQYLLNLMMIRRIERDSDFLLTSVYIDVVMFIALFATVVALNAYCYATGTIIWILTGHKIESALDPKFVIEMVHCGLLFPLVIYATVILTKQLHETTANTNPIFRKLVMLFWIASHVGTSMRLVFDEEKFKFDDGSFLVYFTEGMFIFVAYDVAVKWIVPYYRKMVKLVRYNILFKRYLIMYEPNLSKYLVKDIDWNETTKTQDINSVIDGLLKNE
jgi:hypothetical protein